AAWETDNNAGPYSLDAADFDVDVLPGDRLVGFFEPHRDAYIPIVGARRGGLCETLVEFMGGDHAIIGPATESALGLGEVGTAARPMIHFALETSDNLADWKVVNNRVYTLNANMHWLDNLEQSEGAGGPETDIHVSG